MILLLGYCNFLYNGGFLVPIRSDIWEISVVDMQKQIKIWSEFSENLFTTWYDNENIHFKLACYWSYFQMPLNPIFFFVLNIRDFPIPSGVIL